MDAWSTIAPLYGKFPKFAAALGRVVGRANAEDIVQDAFVRLKAAVERGHVQEPAHYLERTLENGLRQFLRDYREDPVGLEPTPIHLDMDSYPRALFRADFIRGLKQLESAPRYAFILTSIRGLTQAESAFIMGVSQPTVSRLAESARLDLKEMLS